MARGYSDSSRACEYFRGHVDTASIEGHVNTVATQGHVDTASIEGDVNTVATQGHVDTASIEGDVNTWIQQVLKGM